MAAKLAETKNPLFEEALDALEISCKEFDSEVHSLGGRTRACSERLTNEQRTKQALASELDNIIYDMDNLSRMLQAEDAPEVDSSSDDEEAVIDCDSLDLETRIANLAQGMWEASEERRRLVANLVELEERHRQHMERYGTRIRHRRADMERAGVVWAAKQDGMEAPQPWDESDERRKLVMDIEKFEAQEMMGAHALEEKIQGEREKIEGAEIEFQKKAVARLQKGEKVNGLDSWFVPSSRPVTTHSKSRPATHESCSWTGELSRSAFPPKQEEMLFTVEEERLDQAALDAEKAMLKEQAELDKQRYELERLRKLEQVHIQKGGTVKKSNLLEENDGVERTTEQEISHWRLMALDLEAELHMTQDKCAIQERRIAELEKQISQMRDKQVRDQQRYAKELNTQSQALNKLKTQADSSDTKAMIKRMVDMARQLSEMTQAKEEVVAALEKQQAEHREQLKKLHGKIFEMDASVTSRSDAINKHIEQAEADRFAAVLEKDELRSRLREVEGVAQTEIEQLRSMLLRCKQQIEDLSDANHMNVEMLMLSDQRAQIASDERDLALRGLATYRDRHPDANTPEPSHGDARVITAWKDLLGSLPKRTKIKVLTKNAFRKVVNELHQERVQNVGVDKVPEPVFLQDFFHKRYGLEEIADTYLFGFLCSLQKYTPQEMGFSNPGVVYYLSTLRLEVDQALESRKCVIMPVNE